MDFEMTRTCWFLVYCLHWLGFTRVSSMGACKEPIPYCILRIETMKTQDNLQYCEYDCTDGRTARYSYAICDTNTGKWSYSVDIYCQYRGPATPAPTVEDTSGYASLAIIGVSSGVTLTILFFVFIFVMRYRRKRRRRRRSVNRNNQMTQAVFSTSPAGAAEYNFGPQTPITNQSISVHDPEMIREIFSEPPSYEMAIQTPDQHGLPPPYSERLSDTGGSDRLSNSSSSK